MDFMTVPMAYIRLGVDCWLHYFRRGGAAFLTNNQVHMKRRMIAYMPGVYKTKEELKALVDLLYTPH